MDFQNSCAPVVLTPLLMVPTQERPSQVSSHLEPHGRLAQGGSVAWFLSCGPMKVEPSHPRWRLGSWGAVLPQPSGQTSPQRPRLPLGPERLWAPKQPGACLTVLAAGWLQAGAPRTRLGSGDPRPSCWTDTPPHNPPPSSDSFILVLLIGLGEGWEVPWMAAGSLFSQARTDWGCLQGPSLWCPDEESSRSCSSFCLSLCINICVEAAVASSDGLFLGVELLAGE